MAIERVAIGTSPPVDPRAQTLGFIGLGSMGMPMVKNLLARGFTVRGFDVRAATSEALEAAGGIRATDRKSVV